MKISLRRQANGEVAFQRIVLQADETGRAAKPSACKQTVPSQARSFIDTLLGAKGRAIVARINPRFRQPKLDQDRATFRISPKPN